MLSPNHDSVSEVMLSSSSDPGLSVFPHLEKDLHINIDLQQNLTGIDCSIEPVGSYDLEERLPFDEEMEVVINDFSSPSNFVADPLLSKPSILKKSNVTAVRPSGKRKLTSRKVSWDNHCALK